MKITLYILAIVIANIVTSHFAPFHLWGLLVPQGTVLIGLTFVLRDLVQLKHGRAKTYLVILAALAISALSTVLMGNGVRIVIASALSFALSEFMDTEIFTRWKGKLFSRIAISGTVGSILDSVVFTLAAGFPTQAIWGQLIVKTVMQLIGAGIVSKIKKPVRFEKNGFLVIEDFTDIEDPFHIHHAQTGLFLTSFPTLQGALYRCDEGEADEEYFDLTGHEPALAAGHRPTA